MGIDSADYVDGVPIRGIIVPPPTHGHADVVIVGTLRCERYPWCFPTALLIEE
jgi:hypothetical protein